MLVVDLRISNQPGEQQAMPPHNTPLLSGKKYHTAVFYVEHDPPAIVTDFGVALVGDKGAAVTVPNKKPRGEKT